MNLTSIYKIPKPLLFGVWSAIGGVLFALILGESFTYLTKDKGLDVDPALKSKNTVVLLDTSGSMAGIKIDEVKRAAAQFAAKYGSAENSRLSLVSFSSNAKLEVPLGANNEGVVNSISWLNADGGTNMSDAFRAAYEQLSNQPLNDTNSVLIFTDGAPANPLQALAEARKLRSLQIGIYAIGTQDADKSFLRSAVGLRNNVFDTSNGNFLKAFERAGDFINSRHLLGTGGSHNDFKRALIQSAGWTGILSLGLVLFLTYGQQLYLGKIEPQFGKLSQSLIVGFFAGIVCGSLGQVIYFYVSSNTDLVYFSLHVISCVSVVYFAHVLSKNFDIQKTGRGSKLCFLGGISTVILANGIYLLYGNYKIVVIPAVALVIWLLRRLKEKSVLLYVIYGAVAGAVPLWFIYELISGYYFDYVIRSSSWAVLGSSIGIILCYSIPNLKPRKAAVGGAVGGALGALAFIFVSNLLGDVAGRLIGASIIGFSIGGMVAIAEKASALAWVRVKVEGADSAPLVALGDKPLSMGNQPEHDIQLTGLTFDESPRLFGEVYISEDGTPRVRLDPKFQQDIGLTRSDYSLDDSQFKSLFKDNLQLKAANKSGLQFV